MTTISRRDVLTLLGGAAAVLAETRSALADHAPWSAGQVAALRQAHFYSAYAAKKGPEFGLGTLAEADDRSWAGVVEARMHGGAVRPGAAELVIVARRPGSFMLVIDARNGAVLQTIAAIEGRMFFGHAVFSADGRWLYTTEAAYEAGAGLVGVYDAGRGYKRVAEWATGGIGPHELIVAPDGRSLWVANGGVDTHPDSGRAVLNEGAIQSSLVRIDLDGRTMAKHELPVELASLSIRHIAARPDGSVVFGCQDQGDVAAGLPLVGVARGNGTCDVTAAGDDVWPLLNGYVGSVALDASGELLAATSPRGNRVLFQLIADQQKSWLFPLADVCGVAAQGEPRRFLLTSGNGDLVDVGIEDAGPRVIAQSQHARRWDNHIIRA